MSYPLYTKFNFYMMSIVQTILPFILLTCFNIIIIYLTHKRLYKTSHGMKFYMLGFTDVIRQESKNRKIHQELKYATRTMVAIVFTYLTCNVFSVFMSVMENVFPESSMLVDNYGSRKFKLCFHILLKRIFEYFSSRVNCFSTKFYTMAADLVSILVVLNSLLRMTVHMICNPQFRERFRLILVKFRF
ncbi:unnamed protein product [Brugia pahangi]|uniref:G_PROTEIN_RECEP_F1_2 domain-containing protein n=1 Tax=Brugia pahangi TaxID=6280 RepID=A0A0N4TE58_BRUPA|nr:unnamed protein product [Brugia pahangi]